MVDRLLTALRTRPELTDLASDQQNGGRRAMVVIDRDAAARFGVTAEQIDDALYSAFGQRLVSTILTQLNQYHVVMEVGRRISTESACSERHLRADDHRVACAFDHDGAPQIRCQPRCRSTTRVSFPR